MIQEYIFLNCLKYHQQYELYQYTILKLSLNFNRVIWKY
jgi:hypothetical protein